MLSVFHSSFNFRTYVARQANSWIDDYKDWSLATGCCKQFISNNSFCPHEMDSTLCTTCYREETDDFEVYFGQYLNYFLNDNADEKCSKGGKAAYADVSISLRIYILYIGE